MPAPIPTKYFLREGPFPHMGIYCHSSLPLSWSYILHRCKYLKCLPRVRMTAYREFIWQVEPWLMLCVRYQSHLAYQLSWKQEASRLHVRWMPLRCSQLCCHALGFRWLLWKSLVYLGINIWREFSALVVFNQTTPFRLFVFIGRSLIFLNDQVIDKNLKCILRK